MIKIENKYQIGIKRFNVNWIGVYSLYCKETLRFLSVFGQTIIGPIITAILFLVVIYKLFSTRFNCDAIYFSIFCTFLFLYPYG